ncbi:hypothetical protein [Streptomyces sp. NPDC050804]|nr:hypothetical protein OG214_22125 [Streptomyces sp. NBC_00872]
MPQRPTQHEIADQGDWAQHSRSMLGYVRCEDGWDDNASVGLT